MRFKRGSTTLLSLAGIVAGGMILPVGSTGPVVPAASAVSIGESFGVYVRLVAGLEDEFDDVLQTFRAGIGEDWTLVADYEAGVNPDDCSYRAHVFILSSPEHAGAVLGHGPRAAFAVPVRVAVYQDEGGINIAAANPQSIDRTIVAESGFEDQSQEVVTALRKMVAQSFPGNLVDEQYGQMRDQGLIKKTMGMIAGGPFAGKIEKIASVKVEGNQDLAAVASRLYSGLEQVATERKWKIHPVYRLDMIDQNAVLIGLTGTPIEARAFHIVGSGGDHDRKDMACPGLDHAAAFPFEVLLTQEGDKINILMVDAMFRMKIYFEDAGKMKFAANMRMPGSIENEVRDKVEETLF